MEPRRGDVEGDLDLGAQPRKLVQGSLLGAVGVGRGQDPQLLARLAVAPERIYQRADAAPADERHHEVDSVRRRHLGAEFVPNCRLPGRVREDRRVEQRRERPLNRLCPPVRRPLQQRHQDLPRTDELVRSEVVPPICQSLEMLDQCARNTYRLVASFFLRRPLDRSREHRGEVAGNTIRRLGVPQLGEFGKKRPVGDLREQRLEPAR
jgi:hypothetical protein